MTTIAANEPKARAGTLAYASLHDVQCPVTVVLGTGRITIRECLALRPDSIVMLSQAAGEDLMLLANGVQVARGEVLVFDDGAALRVTEISAPPPPKAVA